MRKTLWDRSSGLIGPLRKTLIKKKKKALKSFSDVIDTNLGSTKEKKYICKTLQEVFIDQLN